MKQPVLCHSISHLLALYLAVFELQELCKYVATHIPNMNFMHDLYYLLYILLSLYKGYFMKLLSSNMVGPSQL